MVGADYDFPLILHPNYSTSTSTQSFFLYVAHKNELGRSGKDTLVVSLLPAQEGRGSFLGEALARGGRLA